MVVPLVAGVGALVGASSAGAVVGPGSRAGMGAIFDVSDAGVVAVSSSEGGIGALILRTGHVKTSWKLGKGL